MAYVGGTRFSEFCKELEQSARSGDADHLRAALPSLEARIGRIEQELKAYLRT